jgi:hypothetical protein
MDFTLLLLPEQDPKIVKLKLDAYFLMKTGAQLARDSTGSPQNSFQLKMFSKIVNLNLT